MSLLKPWEEFAQAAPAVAEKPPWEEFAEKPVPAEEKKPWEEFAAPSDNKSDRSKRLAELRAQNPEATGADIAEQFKAETQKQPPSFTGLASGVQAPEERGFFPEAGHMAARGGIELEGMAGNIARAVAPEGSAVADWGKRRQLYSDAVKEHDPFFAPSIDPEKKPIQAGLTQGAAMVIPSMAVPAAIGLAAPLAGIGAGAAAVGGGLAGAAAFGLSQGQETFERGVEAGLSPEDARAAAIKSGVIEGAGESIGNLFGPAKWALRGGRPLRQAAVKLIKDVSTRQGVKEVARKAAWDYIKTAGAETLTEEGQQIGERIVDITSGIDKTPITADEIFQTALATIGMTTFMAPLGLAGHVQQAQANNRISKLLQDGAADPASRLKATQAVAEALKTEDPRAAAIFVQKATEAIRTGQSIALDGSALEPSSAARSVNPEAAVEDNLDYTMAAPAAEQAVSPEQFEQGRDQLAADLREQADMAAAEQKQEDADFLMAAADAIEAAATPEQFMAERQAIIESIQQRGIQQRGLTDEEKYGPQSGLSGAMAQEVTEGRRQEQRLVDVLAQRAAQMAAVPGQTAIQAVQGDKTADEINKAKLEAVATGQAVPNVPVPPASTQLQNTPSGDLTREPGAGPSLEKQPMEVQNAAQGRIGPERNQQQYPGTQAGAAIPADQEEVRQEAGAEAGRGGGVERGQEGAGQRVEPEEYRVPEEQVGSELAKRKAAIQYQIGMIQNGIEAARANQNMPAATRDAFVARQTAEISDMERQLAALTPAAVESELFAKSEKKQQSKVTSKMSAAKRRADLTGSDYDFYQQVQDIGIKLTEDWNREEWEAVVPPGLMKKTGQAPDEVADHFGMTAEELKEKLRNLPTLEELRGKKQAEDEHIARAEYEGAQKAKWTDDQNDLSKPGVGVPVRSGDLIGGDTFRVKGQKVTVAEKESGLQIESGNIVVLELPYETMTGDELVYIDKDSLKHAEAEPKEAPGQLIPEKEMPFNLVPEKRGPSEAELAKRDREEAQRKEKAKKDKLAELAQPLPGVEQPAKKAKMPAAKKRKAATNLFNQEPPGGWSVWDRLPASVRKEIDLTRVNVRQDIPGSTGKEGAGFTIIPLDKNDAIYPNGYRVFMSGDIPGFFAYDARGDTVEDAFDKAWNVFSARARKATVVKAPVEPIKPKLPAPKSKDKGRPEPGKQYALTGGPGTKSIMGGATWAESEVKPAKPEVKSPVSNLSDADQAELKALQDAMRKKLLGQVGMGLDPEVLTIGAKMAALYVKGGTKTFSQFATNMKADMADIWDRVKVYLHSIWQAAGATDNTLDDISRADAAKIVAELEKPAEVTPEEQPKLPPAKTETPTGAPGMEIVEQFHTKRGHNVYIVTMANRVSSDKFKELAREARMLGGKWSPAWKPTKSPAGFMFNRREQAEAFMNGQVVEKPKVPKSQSEIAKAFQEGGRGAVLPERVKGSGVTTTTPKEKDLFDLQSGEKPLESISEREKSHDTGTKMERGSEEALAGTPAEDVSADAEGRDAGQTPGRSGRGDEEGVARPDRPERGRGSRVGDGEGKLPASAVRGRRAELGRSSVVQQPTSNFRITADTELGSGSPETRIRNNIDAIKLAKKLTADGRLPTPEEQAVLIKYVGWGGLPGIFEKHLGWAWEAQEKGEKEDDAAGTGTKDPLWPMHQELRGLLSPEEYDNAEASTLNAHYTNPHVIRGMYDALEHFGFKGGRMLETSAGIGHFIGLQPDLPRKTTWVAVEKDATTGMILKLLYPDATVNVRGYEETSLPDNFFDVAMSNVPFGDFQVADKKYDKYRFLIHDYFFAKSLDKVRPGGLVAFITSSGTLDKINAKLRDYITKHGGQFVGAIRLPNTAFKANAGTDVVTDVIFIRKTMAGETVDNTAWDEIADISLKNKDGESWQLSINGYFKKNRDMILGKLIASKAMYGSYDMSVEGKADGLGARIAEAAQRLPGNIISDPVKDAAGKQEKAEAEEPIAAPGDLLEGNLTIHNGKVMAKRGGNLEVVKAPRGSKDFLAKVERMITIRTAARTVLQTQQKNEPDDIIQGAIDELNRVYDRFVKKHGFIHADDNKAIIDEESDASLLFALETWDIDTKTAIKNDIFTKRLIVPKTRPETAANIKDAVNISLNETGAIDFDLIAELLNSKPEAVEQETLKERLAFRNPETNRIEPRGEYLSGFVRRKLESAKAAADIDQVFKANVEELEKVQPKWKSHTAIGTKLGSSWITPDTYREFIGNLLDIRSDSIKVEHHESDGAWDVYMDRRDRWRQNAKMTSTYGVNARNDALWILSRIFNGKSLSIWEKDADGHRFINIAQTALAKQKAEAMQNEFDKWIWAEERRADMEAVFNNTVNGYAPQEWDGSGLTLNGMNAIWQARLAAPGREFQKNGIARGVQGGNLLLAWEVGAGKTIAMAAMGMEMRRLGLIRKPMYVVPNHMLEQWAGEFREAYPLAKLLLARPEDLDSAEGRKLFVARTATGDWDGVLIRRSSFLKIGVSRETEMAYINEELNQLREAYNQAQEAQEGRRETRAVKRLRKAIENMEVKIERLMNKDTKDIGLTFEDLGVDQLFIDEAHNYKGLMLKTGREPIPGLTHQQSQTAMDLEVKARYVTKLHNNKRGLVFATGTPITNTIGEMYVMQRYLCPQLMQEHGVAAFDDWCNMFGQAVNRIEMNPTGRGYSAKTRFAAFVNVGPMKRIFRSVADVVTEDDLKVPKPKIKDGRPKITSTAKSEWQTQYIDQLVERAKAIKDGHVDPSKDNMLVVTNDGRKVALDERLIDLSRPDDPNSKLNTVIKNVYSIWKSTGDVKGAQLVFSDLGVPGGSTFDVYAEMKSKLIGMGIPAEEIAFIHDAKSDEDKAQLFARVRSGAVRVLIGNTPKMGEGTNVQTRLVALHHVDVPWKPAWLIQRNGRILRPGNMNEEVIINCYATEGSFDVYMWQTVERKARFIAQAMNNDLDVDKIEDVDETVLTAEMVKAIASGDPLILEQATLNQEFSELASGYEGFQQGQAAKMAEQHRYEKKIGEEELKFHAAQKALSQYNTRRPDEFPKPLLQSILAKATGMAKVVEEKEFIKQSMIAGEYAGFPVELTGIMNAEQVGDKIGFKRKINVLVRDGTVNGYKLDANILLLEEDIKHIPQSVGHHVASLKEIVAGANEKLVNLRKQLAEIQKESTATYPRVARLHEVEARLEEINAQLGMTDDDTQDTEEGGDSTDEAAGNTDEETKFSLGEAAKPTIKIGDRVWNNGREFEVVGSPTMDTEPRAGVDWTGKMVAQVQIINKATGKPWQRLREFPVDELTKTNFSLRDRSGPGMARAEVIDAVNAVSDLVGPVIVLQSEDEIPAAVRNQPKFKDYAGRIEGFEHNGEIYLVADHLTDARHAQAKAFHEAFHAGFKKALTGEQRNKILNATFTKFGRMMELAAIARKYDLDLAIDKDYERAMEELFAKITQERKSKPQVWKRFVGAIRQALRDMGLLKTMSDEDIDYLIERALEARANKPGRSQSFQADNATITAPGVQPAFSLAAYHGTPHTFEPEPKFPLGRFKKEKVGTGEGAAAYGWGVAYVAEAKETAEWYKDTIRPSRDSQKLSPSDVSTLMQAPEWPDEAPRYVLDKYATDEETFELSRRELARYDKLAKKTFNRTPLEEKEFKKLIQKRNELFEKSLLLPTWDDIEGEFRAYGVENPREVIEKINNNWNFKTRPVSGGNLYHVEIDADPADFLDWDKPLSEQSEKVKSAILSAGYRIIPNTYPSLKQAEALFRSERVQQDAARDIGTREVMQAGWKLVKAGDESGFRRWFNNHGKSLSYGRAHDKTGSNFYEEMSARGDGYNPQKASEYLAGLGIKGIRYADQNSRPAVQPRDPYMAQDGKRWVVYDAGGANERWFDSRTGAEKHLATLPKAERRAPTFNYVVFNESDIRVVGRNGQVLTPTAAMDEEGAKFSLKDKVDKTGIRDTVRTDEEDKLQRAYDAAPVDEISGVRSLITARRVPRNMAVLIAARSRAMLRKWERLSAEANQSRKTDNRPAGDSKTGLDRDIKLALDSGLLPELSLAQFGINQTALQNTHWPWKGILSKILDRISFNSGEGIVFKTKDDQVVYKFFVPYLGFNGEKSIASHAILEVRNEKLVATGESGNFSQLLERLAVMGQLGAIPTELIGVTKQGVVVIKQPYGIDQLEQPNRNYTKAEARARIVSLEGIIDTDEKVAPRLAVVDGRAYLIEDMRHENKIFDTHNRQRILDPVIGEIPDSMLDESPLLEGAVQELRASEKDYVALEDYGLKRRRDNINFSLADQPEKRSLLPAAKSVESGGMESKSGEGRTAPSPKTPRPEGRITPEQDAAYLAAVERGDMETAQKMVDEGVKNSANPKINWVAAYNEGKKAKDSGFKSERQYFESLSFEELNSRNTESPELAAFFSAGFSGKEMPRFVLGWRYGDIPPGGRSANFRDQMYERGVSMMRIDEETETSAAKLYEVFNKGNRNLKRYGGWFIGHGADGEPLLVGVKQFNPVLRDSSGKVIPLSERFNRPAPGGEGAKFSLTDDSLEFLREHVQAGRLYAGVEKAARDVAEKAKRMGLEVTFEYVDKKQIEQLDNPLVRDQLLSEGYTDEQLGKLKNIGGIFTAWGKHERYGSRERSDSSAGTRTASGVPEPDTERMGGIGGQYGEERWKIILFQGADGKTVYHEFTHIADKVAGRTATEQRAKELSGRMERGEDVKFSLAEKPERFKAVRTLAQLKADPRVELAEADEDGKWIYLKDGWYVSEDGTHAIREDTWGEAITRFNDYVEKEKTEPSTSYSLSDKPAPDSFTAELMQMLDKYAPLVDRAAGTGYAVGKAEGKAGVQERIKKTGEKMRSKFEERMEKVRQQAEEKREKAVMAARMGERAKGRKEGIKEGIRIGLERGEETGRTLGIEDTIKIGFAELAREYKSRYLDKLQEIERLMVRVERAGEIIDAEGKVTGTRTPEQTQEAQDWSLGKIFGAERYREIRRVAHRNNRSVVMAVRETLRKELSRHYLRELGKLLRNTGSNKVQKFLPQYRDAWLKEIEGLTPESYTPALWEDARKKYEKLMDIKAASMSEQYLQATARRGDADAAGMLAAEELRENVRVIPKSELGTPRRRNLVKNWLVDKAGVAITRALGLSGGDESGVSYEVLYKTLKMADTAARQFEAETVKPVTDLMKSLGITESKVIDWRTRIVPTEVGGETVLMTAAEKMELAAALEDPETNIMIGLNGWSLERRKGQLEARILGGTPGQTLDMANEVVNTLTADQKRIVKLMVDQLTAMGKEGNKVSVALEGWEKFTKERYWPRKVDRSTTPQTVDLDARAHYSASLKNIGFTKERVASTHPVMTGDIFATFYEHAHMMSKYAKLSLAVHDANVLLGHPVFADEIRLRLGTGYIQDTRLMLQNLSGLRGYKDMSGIHRFADMMTRNVAVSILWFRATSIIFNRYGGSLLAFTELLRNNPAAAMRFMVRAPMPIFLNSADGRQIVEILMQNGYMADRWGHDMAHIYSPLPHDRAGDTSATKFKMRWRKMQEWGMRPMANAEMRNMVAVYKALVKSGVSSAEAVQTCEDITRATQNPSTALEESAAYSSIKSASLGWMFPFLGQPMVSRNLVMRDAILLKNAVKSGNNAKKRHMAACLTATIMGLVGNVVLEQAVRAMLRKLSRPPPDDEPEENKDVMYVLMDSAASLCDYLIPGTGKVMDGIKTFASGRQPRDASFIGGIISKSNSGLRKVTNPYNRDDEYDPVKMEKGITDLLEAAGNVVGGPVGGPLQYYRVARNLMRE